MAMDESDTGSGRRPRAGESGAPVGSILSIILAVAAVLIGLFILRQISDDDDGITGPRPNTTNGSEVTTPSDGTGPGGSRPPGTTAVTPPIDVREGATVVVANASDVGGSAGQMSDQFRAEGFETGTPVDAAGAETRLDQSRVYYSGDRRARAVAQTAARLLGGVEVQRMPRNIPVQGGEIDGEVLVMLGIDEAGQSLEELTQASPGTEGTGAETEETTAGTR